MRESWRKFLEGGIEINLSLSIHFVLQQSFIAQFKDKIVKTRDHIMTQEALSIVIVVVAVIVALSMTIIKPEVPEYVPFNLQEFQANCPSKYNSKVVRFVGGDGITMLTGRIYLPTTSPTSKTEEDNNVESSSSSTSNNTSSLLPPIVIMAHGMGLIQDNGLYPFVEAFLNENMAVFTFDYATFGASDGLPRHRIYPNSHVNDILAAINHITTGGGGESNNNNDVDEEWRNLVDTSRIGLWGTSLGGGHVLIVQAKLMQLNQEESRLKAVISQVPHIASGFESIIGSLLYTTPRETFMGVVLYVLGLIQWLINLVFYQNNTSSSYFPIVGQPGTAAMMQNYGDYDGYMSNLAPTVEKAGVAYSNTNYGWKNSATTESGLHLLMYRPLSFLLGNDVGNGNGNDGNNGNDGPPILLIAAEYDTLCPAKYVQRAQQHLGTKRAKLVTLKNVGHFDAYQGNALQDILNVQVPFLKNHLFY